MKKKHAFWISVLLLTSLSACSSITTPKATLTPVSVQLLWTHQAQFAGFYAADQNGYYAAEGLSVTFLEGGPTVGHWNAVLDGAAQFGIAGGDELILARSEGKPVRAIATIYRRSPTVFISLKDSGITRPEEFSGKKIRAPANTAPTLYAMTEKVGISPDQYTVITDLPSDLALFASGEVPVWGVYLTGFVITAEQAGYQLNIIYPDDYGVHFYADTLFATDDLLAKDPDLATRFLRATLKGWTYAVENPNEMGAMVAKYNPGADAALENTKMLASLPLVNTGEDHIGWMKPEIWSGMEQTLHEQGVLTNTVAIAQVYTLQFLEGIYSP
jgi:NitT/TauT family transport system substrate-binding protein